MALECERWVWLQAIASEHGPTDPTTRLVLMTLSLHMNQLGEQAFPSQRLLATRSGLSERSVRAHLQIAEREGWVQRFSKRPKGQGWALHEYGASVPDALQNVTKSPPWHAEPGFERAEPVAAGDRGFTPINRERPAAPAAPSRVGHASSTRTRPANDAGRPADGAEGAATDDTTCGKPRPNVRNDVPLKSSSNPSVNPSMNPSGEGALASSHTAPTGEISRNSKRKAESEMDKQQAESKARRHLAQIDKDADASLLAKMYRIPVERAVELKREAAA